MADLETKRLTGKLGKTTHVVTDCCLNHVVSITETQSVLQQQFQILAKLALN